MTKNAMPGFFNKNLQQFNRSYPQNDMKEALNDIYFDNNHLYIADPFDAEYGNSRKNIRNFMPNMLKSIPIIIEFNLTESNHRMPTNRKSLG